MEETRIKDGEWVRWTHAAGGFVLEYGGEVARYVPAGDDVGVAAVNGRRRVPSTSKPRYVVQTPQGPRTPNAATLERQNPDAARVPLNPE
jgi:hypothetical protein